MSASPTHYAKPQGECTNVQLIHRQQGSRQQKIAPAILSAQALIVEWGSKTTPVETRSGARPPTLGHEKRAHP